MYVDPSGYGSDKCGQQNSSQYPPRTKEAREEAQKVAKAMDDAKISKKQNQSVTVILHKDGTVSVGMSGKSGDQRMQTQVSKLQNELGENYKVSADSMPTDNIKKRANEPGICSEPKAINAAHENPSEIVGYDTVWRGKGENPHPFTGENVGGNIKSKKYEQMDPCGTCKDPENIKEYMDYANANKQ